MVFEICQSFNFPKCIIEFKVFETRRNFETFWQKVVFTKLEIMIIASYENALLCQQKFIELQMTTLADAFSICLGKPQELLSRRR